MLTGDGGGRAPAPARPLRGRDLVIRTLLTSARYTSRVPGMHLRPTELNGAPGALLLDGEDRVTGVWVLDVDGPRIRAIRSIVNPDKLAHLGPTADLGSLLRLRPPGSGGSHPPPAGRL